MIQIKKKANKLQLKYIEWESQYEILIGTNVREIISDTMSHIGWTEDDDIDLSHLMNLLNDCCNEIFAILISRFGRFQSTKQYTQLPLTKTGYHSFN